MAARLLIALLLFTLVACNEKAPAAGDTTADITIAGQTFKLELALNNKTRYQGLSDRDHIADDGGMMFVFTGAAVRGFVMRRCLVPIDIIFVGHNGRIVKMHAMEVEPPETFHSPVRTYSSEWPAKFAIELKGGTLEKLQLKPGDRIDFPWDTVAKYAE